MDERIKPGCAVGLMWTCVRPATGTAENALERGYFSAGTFAFSSSNQF